MTVKTARGVEVLPIDRLEEKIKALVGLVERLRADQTRLVDENQRLTLEADSARARLADIEASASEVLSLREERELVRTRVADMLEQLEALPM
jgi:regulator of replication initiation timing